MATLAINTASKTTATALLEGREILCETSWISTNNEAEKLMPEIAKLLKKLPKEQRVIGKIIVVRGPGSFTGLRVGTAAANTIAHLNKIPVFSLDTFTLLRHSSAKIPASAAKIPAPAAKTTASASAKTAASTSAKTAASASAKTPAVVVLFAGKNEIYIQPKEGDKPILAGLGEAAALLKGLKSKKICGELLEHQKKVLKGLKFTETKKTFGEIIADMPEEKFEKSKLAAPLYIKGPGISKPNPICFT